MNPSGGQLGLPGMGVENRSLFSEHFLDERLPAWEEFRAIDSTAIFPELKTLWDREGASIATASEAQTEDRLIQPILDLLGFERQVQPNSRLSTGRRIPDYALFTSLEDRQTSETAEGLGRFEHAAALAEAKAFAIALDKSRAGAGPQEDPEAQVLDYMWRTRVRWAILTNGREWRLYGQAGDLVEAAHLSIPDLPGLIEAEDLDQLRYFLAFFSADSFRPGDDGRSFLDRAFAESEANARRIGESLKDQMFAAVPKIATGLIGNSDPDEETLESAFSNSLVVLYRLLFCLYAESRELLPVSQPHYAAYGLRGQRERIVGSGPGAMRSDRLYNDLENLFRLVDEGDVDLGINQYNGGLFSEESHPWLTGRSVPDPLMRDALISLFTVDGEQIDYRDLSIRHLGTMYEELLERNLALEDGQIVLTSADDRHDSGSYFTPESIVDAIVERTLDPVLGQISERVQDAGLTGEDARREFLEVTVCDPSMGSGHFLVSAATFVSRFIATDPSQEGEETNELAIRRRVAERCLYGVDLNPMAVELARLALWLVTVDDSRPLTFLDNLKAGNSVIGADIDDLRSDILFDQRLTTEVARLIEAGDEIRATPSNLAAEVHAKEDLARESGLLRNELEGFADESIARYFPDGLERPFHWEIEFPEVFFNPDGTPGNGLGFDAIIGNPPYVQTQSMPAELRNFLRGTFESAHGSFDLYIVFIERAFGLLASTGRLGFIVPNKFLKLASGTRLRALLASGQVVDEVIDFGDIQIFEGATNYTCLLGLSPEPNEELAYIRVEDPGHVPLPADIDRSPVERFRTDVLGEDPWLLVPARERSIMDSVFRSSTPLGGLTEAIFTGLQTSADPIYIVEDRGPGPNGRRVFSRKSGVELELESDLLHPLASGKDIDRWAVRPLGELLIFPYRRAEGEMRLLTPAELDALPLTAAYLKEHEAALRGRERDKMDHAEWYGYVYPKSLGLHELPKLGVPRLCDRLHTAIDPDGVVYLDNVDVNGIIPSPDGPSLWFLASLLNSRVLDFIFRLQSVPFRGAFYSANKQFIAPLPIRLPDSAQTDQLEALAKELHQLTSERNAEQQGFRDWLGSLVETPVSGLARHTHLNAYETLGADGVLAVLRHNRRRLTIDPDSRAITEQVKAEYDTSLGKLAPLNSGITAAERALEDAVFDLYEMTAAHRATINAEYDN